MICELVPRFRAVLAVLALGLIPSTGGAQEHSPYAGWKNGPPADAEYFPIAVWLQNPSNAARYKEAGINLYVGLWRGPTDEQLATLKQAGMPVICSQNRSGLAHKDDPIIVGWMHGDEPDNAQPVRDPNTGKRSYGPPVPPPKIVADYEKYRTIDPTRPVMLNLGQGVANDAWKGRGSGAKLDDYLTYVQGGDVISYDVYPVAGVPRQNGQPQLWLVAKGLDRLAKWSESKKILWNCIECTRIDNDHGKATPAQVKAEVWMSLVHGSNGLIYFVHEFKPKFNEHALLDDPEMLAAVTAINKQIRELAPVLNRPPSAGVGVQSSNTDVPIDAMARERDGKTYVFAVGMRNGSSRASFQVQGLPASATAEVLGESRMIAVKNGRFQDDFGPYAVHLYQIR